MGVDRITSTFQRNNAMAQRTAKVQLDFILQNLRALALAKNGSRMVEDARDISDVGEDFTPAQMSYIDGMYEKVMEMSGFEGVDRHIDQKKKGLKYG